MNILVLNLERSPDRLRHMQGALGALRLPFERIPAVEGRLIPQAERTAFAAARPGYRWTPGEIGCLFSHAEAWRRASERPDQWTVVLEDDVRLSPALPGFLAEIDRLPPSVDVCRFEASLGRLTWLGPEAARCGEARVHVLASKVMGSAAYAIRGRSARRLLTQIQSVKVPADAIFIPDNARELALLVTQTVPVFAEQSLDGTSTINPARKRRPKLPPLARIWREVRRPILQAFDAARLGLAGNRPASLRLTA